MDITRRKGHTLGHHTMTIINAALTIYFKDLVRHDYNICDASRLVLLGCESTLRDYNSLNADYVWHILDAMVDIANGAYKWTSSNHSHT